MKKVKKFFKQTGRRLSWSLYRKRALLKNKIKDLITDGCKLHIGCGLKKYKGYINIDIVPLEGCDVVMDAVEDLQVVPSDIVSEIKMEGVFEHFYRDQQPRALKEYQRVLKRGGKLIITELPNFDNIIEAYQRKESWDAGKLIDLFEVYRMTHGEPEQGNAINQLHKDLFNKQSIRELLETAGFHVDTIEDEKFAKEKTPMYISITASKK